MIAQFMPYGHHMLNVVLSVVIAVLGSWTALDLHRRASAHIRLVRVGWLAASALAMGLSIWSMHFVAMLGFDAGVPVRYDVGGTFASLLLPIIATAGAFLAVERPGPSQERILAAGVAMGSGICLMHYVGMGAIQAPVALSYDLALVLASLLIAVGASWAALQVALGRPSPVLRALGALLLGAAIISMHFTAMAATRFTPVPAAHSSIAAIDHLTLALGVATSTVLLLFLALLAAMFDRRFEVQALREAQASVRAESEERLRAIVDTAVDAIVVIDAAGVIQSFNPAAERIFGYLAAEAVGRDVHMLMPQVHAAAGDRTTRTGGPGGMASIIGAGPEVEGRRKDGTSFPLDLSITEWRDATGQRFFTGIMRDITARKASEAALRDSEARLRELNETLAQRVAAAVAEREAAQAQLHEVQKLETLGQLTGGVAHDINNLLTPIVASLDLLQRQFVDNERAQRQIAAGLQAAERVRVLIQRLLAFARRQTLEARPVDLAALVEGMIDLIRRSLGPHIDVRIALPPGLPAAKIDPNQLELALLNLSVNARDAMPGGGTLSIGAREELIGSQHPGRLAPGRYVCLSVADTGVGMDAETLRKCIEPFFTTKGVGRGTGLGLSMVHGLAAQSGGTLKLTSRPGAGTCAELWLPAAEQAADAPAAADAPPVPMGRAATILLVDDEELVRAGTADMLADLGYAVVEAGSGAQAIELLRTGLKPDLVISDYAMPSMTGVELARSIRHRAPATPILLITGYANLSDGEAASLPRLAKPFRQAQLATAVAELLTGKVIVMPRRKDSRSAEQQRH